MASEETAIGNDGSIEAVASGQKLIIYAILLNFIAIAVAAWIGDIAGLISIGALVLSIWGLLRLSGGLGYSVGLKILLVVLAFIPLVSLVMLLLVNNKATKTLRAHGYKVGLMGARKP